MKKKQSKTYLQETDTPYFTQANSSKQAETIQIISSPPSPQQYPITHSSLKQARLDSKRTILPKQYLIPIVPRAPTLSATPSLSNVTHRSSNHTYVYIRTHIR